MLDGKAFGQEIVGIVKGHMERTLAPVLVRLKALEDRQPERGEKGDPGEPGAVGPVGPQGEKGLDGAPGERGAPGEPGIQGDKGDPGVMGEKGDPGERGEPGEKGAPGEPGSPGEKGDAGPAGAAGEKGDPGRDGKDVDPDDVAKMIAAEVEKALPSIIEKAAGLIPVPKDGVGLAGAVIDRAGELTLTLTDGSTRSLGSIVGKDGAPGEKGADGLNGSDGKDGLDGLGFEDMTEEMEDDGRTIVRRYVRGDQVKEFRHALPVILDRGVYKAGQTYVRGDAVTWGGSLWGAQEETGEKPDGGKGWRLAVKRGRDGKDAERPAPAKPEGGKPK